MPAHGWKRLIEGWPWFRGEGRFPMYPNSEFMPPVRLARRPYGTWDNLALSEDDPWGWPITEYEELLALRPGLQDIAGQLLNRLVPLCQGSDSHGISEYKLRANPYWPADLASRAPCLEHERFVLLLPLALSLTQNDKAYVRWTLFGNSEQGPARAFWKSFYVAPSREIPAAQAVNFFRTLLSQAYDEPLERLVDLRGIGFRILPLKDSTRQQEPLPGWTTEFLLSEEESLRDVRYVLTFRPFHDLPLALKRKYFAGKLHLLPFPGSLLFWGVAPYQRLSKNMRLVEQVPLLHFLERHEFGKIRIPQSGWFEEGRPSPSRSDHRHLPVRETYKRTYRQVRAHRFEDHLVNAQEHRLAHVLFSTRPQDIGLYYKPMARNVQLWTKDYSPLLHGPAASADDILRAAQAVAAGGVFGYRFLFPAMCVGRHELYWHRPLAAFLDRRGRPALVESAPPGYLTAYRPDEMNFDKPLELWPRLLQREHHLENVALFQGLQEKPPRRTLVNVLKLLDAWERHGRRPLPATFARQLLTTDKRRTLEGWLRQLPQKVQERQRVRARQLSEGLRACVASAEAPERTTRKKSPGSSLTFGHTATRGFEEAYWNTISYLAAGKYVNKNNADCVQDPPTQAALKHLARDLDLLGDYLLDYYRGLVASLGMTEAVQLGELPFRWHTQYPFPWMGGWLHNQEDKTHERNLLVKIPGKDRNRAVVMADHYDTAYMHDRYERCLGGTGARLSAPGADDNCSATAALMLGAHAFLELSRQGKLACDIWLLHLTGEEYPAEGLGACRMCQWLVEGTLPSQGLTGARSGAANVAIQGIYVLDMIAHNNDDDRDVFQIASGASRESQWLAQQAHLANRDWNLATEVWNRQPARRRVRRGKRSRDGQTLPALARFLPLHGEIRPHFDPRSTLFNTDGQGFSDVGVPVVLFMENYDINREGYHDTHDDMKLIDLDYGAALAAITIESVARAATEKPMDDDV